MDIQQGRSIPLTAVPDAQLRSTLKKARRRFEAQGGRGVDLAEQIDNIRFELRSRAAKKAAQTRKAKQTVK